MNRRSFLSSMLVAGVGSMVLPGAGRVWVRPKKLVTMWNPEWVDSEYEERFLVADYGKFGGVFRKDFEDKSIPEGAFIKPITLYGLPRRFISVAYWDGCNATLWKKVAKEFREVPPLIQVWK